VSRVLNDLPGVRKATERQVRLAVEALNYVPPTVKRGPKFRMHRAAGSSQNRRTNTIAVLVVGDTQSWLELPVMASVVSGIAREAKLHGLKVLLEEMPDPAKTPEAIVKKEVDGAVVFLSSHLGTGRFQDILTSVQKLVPVVWAMGGDAGVTGVDHVIPDDRAISRLAFDYLIAQGCRDVAFMTAFPKWAMMRNRGQIFGALAHDAGVDWSHYVVSDSPRDGDLFGPRTVVMPNLESLVERFVNATPRPTGLFSGHDATTAWAHPLLLKMGVVPGRDVKVVSCDNEEIRLAGLDPRPPSVDIGAGDVGAVSVRRLAVRIDQPEEAPVLIKVAPHMPAKLEEVAEG
jgi:DNA-binding LacI/PurR family transcriptional regulator